MEYIKVYKSTVSNASKTLDRQIQLDSAFRKISSPTIKNRFSSLLVHEKLNFWDFGVMATAVIKNGDSVKIICASKCYTCQVVDIIKDPEGELGDIFGWSRQFDSPWKNVCAVIVKSVKQISSEEIKLLLSKSKQLINSFFQVGTELSSFSWTIENSDSAIKSLDKSAFLHKGTAIPVDIRPFFMEEQLKSGQKIPLKLLVGDDFFEAHIEMDTQESARARMFWHSDFSNRLKTLFPHHYQMFKDDLKDSASELFMRFSRIDGYKVYEVSFSGELKQETILHDIVSEVIEEKGSSKDGAVKEYYGKRYERDPANRKKAIKIHGLTCKVCNFNFEETYGERGSDFIEVHHRKPIHTCEGEAQTINPHTDLIPVCSNCHRMIHRRSDAVLTVEELKEILNRIHKAKTL